MPISKVKSGSIATCAVTSEKIKNNTIVDADISPSAAISSSKLTVDTSALETDINTNKFNISLLGFKMAVNEGLTVFNLVDGVVDEFNDESGTDEAEGSNDLYCGTSDYYTNLSCASIPCQPVSAGFASNSITEPDTSANDGDRAEKRFTVPTDMTTANIYVWGAGGGFVGTGGSTLLGESGGGGGFASGTLAVTPGQTLYVAVAEGGSDGKEPGPGPLPLIVSTCVPSIPFPQNTYPLGEAYIGGGEFGASCTVRGGGGGGGGAGMVATAEIAAPYPAITAPNLVIVAGSGAGGGAGGGGGGLIGETGNTPSGYLEQTNAVVTGVGAKPESSSGGGGGQTSGGQSGPDLEQISIIEGGYLEGDGSNNTTTGNNNGATAPGAGSGYYGGGIGGNYARSGGGSSYYGHPQVTCGATTSGQGGGNPGAEGGGVSSPFYVAGTNEGDAVFESHGLPATQPVSTSPISAAPDNNYFGEDGYVLITGTATEVNQVTASSTIVSTSFSATSVPTSARIVVFEENVDTPTLNTDIIASISRDGTNFTNATLSDSGYVTGSSGQRILTGQADISGQPSGQTMRWKLALANNQVKIHGVSLQWS